MYVLVYGDDDGERTYMKRLVPRQVIVISEQEARELVNSGWELRCGDPELKTSQERERLGVHRWRYVYVSRGSKPRVTISSYRDEAQFLKECGHIIDGRYIACPDGDTYAIREACNKLRGG